LIESAWWYRHLPTTSNQKAPCLQSGIARGADIATKAQIRLCACSRPLPLPPEVNVKLTSSPGSFVALRHLREELSRMIGRGAFASANLFGLTQRDRRPAARFGLIFMAAILTLSSSLSHSAPPERADSKLAPWYRSLRQPGTGHACCAIADCRNVKWRTDGQRYEVFIDKPSFGGRAPDAWLPVRPERILRDVDNPTGEAVACYFMREVWCFVPPVGT
jgi:hypothetical protein